MKVRNKIWIEDSKGSVVFGDGRLKILKAVDELGSLNKASKALNMSYRAAWGKVKATEERLGVRLVDSSTGGGAKGGTRLTLKGRALVEKYEKLSGEISDISEKYFEDIFKE